MKTTPLVCAATLVLAASPAWPQDAPKFTYVADATQTLMTSSPAWNQSGVPAWILDLDFKPTLSQGPVAFLADGTLYLPLTSSLALSQASTTFYEAYTRLTPVEGLDLTLGKKRLNIGVGQTFTVGDTINPTMSFFDQKSGFRGVTASWSPNSWFGWTAGLSLERNFGSDRWNPTPTPTSSSAADLAWASQASVLLDKFQGVASLVWSQDRTFNPAVGVSYDLGGVILTGEGAVEFLPQGLTPASDVYTAWTKPDSWTQPAPSGSAGARYTVTINEVDVTASAEYLYWAQGWTSGQTDDWKTAQTPATSASLAMIEQSLPLRDRNNGFFHLDFAQTDAFDLAGLWIVDLQDGSSVAQGTLTLLPWEGLDLIGTFEAASGGSLDAWSGVPLPLWAPQGGSLVRYLVSFQTRYHF